LFRAAFAIAQNLQVGKNEIPHTEVSLMRRLSFVAACLLASLVAPAAIAQPTRATVEITEYFWYGCPHCARLEPKLQDMLARRGRANRFTRIPLNRNVFMAAHQRMFFALGRIGREHDLTPAVQDAIVSGHALLLTESSQAEFLSSHGVSESSYRAAYEAQSVSEACANADRAAHRLGIEHVPVLVIDGSKSVSPEAIVKAMAAKGESGFGEQAVLDAMIVEVDREIDKETQQWR
jgi:thiol:disulfide interchange protein DsbA